MLSEEAIRIVTSHDSAPRLFELNIARSGGAGGGVAYDSLGSISRNNVSNVADTLVVKVKVAKIGLTCVDEDAQELEDGFLAFSLREGPHGGLDQVKLLLKVVEADLSVDAVPVEHLVVHQSRSAQTTVDVLLIEDVEQRLKQDYAKYDDLALLLSKLTSVGELGCKVCHFGQAFHRKDFVDEGLHVSVFHG